MSTHRTRPLFQALGTSGRLVAWVQSVITVRPDNLHAPCRTICPYPLTLHDTTRPPCHSFSPRLFADTTCACHPPFPLHAHHYAHNPSLCPTASRTASGTMRTCASRTLLPPSPQPSYSMRLAFPTISLQFCHTASLVISLFNHAPLFQLHFLTAYTSLSAPNRSRLHVPLFVQVMPLPSTSFFSLCRGHPPLALVALAPSVRLCHRITVACPLSSALELPPHTLSRSRIRCPPFSVTPTSCTPPAISQRKVPPRTFSEECLAVWPAM